MKKKLKDKTVRLDSSLIDLVKILYPPNGIVTERTISSGKTL